MNHATVRIAGYDLPLIGIDASATEERCDKCKRLFHLSEVKIDGDRFMCWSCRMREMIYAKEETKATSVHPH
jgi:hypothetical protein